MPIELPYFTGLGGTCRVQLGTKRADLGFYRDNGGKENGNYFIVVGVL